MYITEKLICQGLCSQFLHFVSSFKGTANKNSQAPALLFVVVLN